MRQKTSIPGIKGVGAFLRTGYCSQTLCRVLDRAYDHPLPEEERALLPLAGGIMQFGYQCGMVWGAAAAAGAEAYRRFGPGAKTEAAAITAAQKIVESFRQRYESQDCSDVTGIDFQSTSGGQMAKYMLKGGPVECFRMSAKYPTVALREIEATLAEEPTKVPDGPVSCAALLAKKMGATELQQAMAAGFAGGIGLSGGACGALGAAIWMLGLRNLEVNGKVGYKSPGLMDAVERFLGSIESEFECETIVGRKFKDIADHAKYLREGGCAELIEALAAAEPITPAEQAAGD